MTHFPYISIGFWVLQGALWSSLQNYLESFLKIEKKKPTQLRGEPLKDQKLL